MIKRCALPGAYQNGLPGKPGRTPLLRATTLADAAALRELQALCVGGDYSARLRVRTALRSLISNIDIDVVRKHAEAYCANDFIFTVYGNGYTVDIETGGPAETMERTFTISKPT